MNHIQSFRSFAPLLVVACLVVAPHASSFQSQNAVNFCASDTGYWQTQSIGVTANTINVISAVDANVCWLAGDSGTIIRTTDGGNTWSLINSGDINTQNISAFEGASDSVAFAGTALLDTASIFRTSNGGLSWTRVFSQYQGFINGIKMCNASQGIALGKPLAGQWTVLKTIDGGETWSQVASPPPQIGNATEATGFNAFDTTYVWFFDNLRHYYFSPDGGETWNPPLSQTSKWVLWINSSDLWLMVSYYRAFRLDHGFWTAAGSPPDFGDPQALVGALGTSEFWLVQGPQLYTQGPVWYTPDAGSSWTNVGPKGLNQYVTLIDMVTLGSEVSAWATGVTAGIVYHYRGILTDVNEDSRLPPQSFSLSQNFPNPFNPITIIRFDVPASAYVSLQVYNALGEEVATLVNSQFAPGSYTVTWEPSGVPTGVYFYRLRAGSFVEAKKCVLLR